MNRFASLLLSSAMLTATSGAAAPARQTAAPPPPPSGRERTRALLDAVKVPLAQALETAKKETGGTPTTAVVKRHGDGAVYEVRLVVGDSERSIEIDAIDGKPAAMREALLTDGRRRSIVELRSLLAVAKVDLIEAIDGAIASVPGSRFLAAESEVEHEALKFSVTLLSDRGLTKVEVNAGTGAVGAPVGEVPKPVEDANVRHFDRDTPGSLPPGWRVGATDPHATPATWQVLADDTAPSAPNVLALVKTNHQDADAFNLCWIGQPLVRNGRVETRFKAISGDEDRGGGIVWHLKDARNYNLCRFNPLENNFRVYVVKDGVRTQLGSAKATLSPGEWHTMGARFVGDRIECSLDGQRLLEARDSTFPGAGGVGFWTKADALTRFDDFRIEPLDDYASPVEAPAAKPEARPAAKPAAK